MPFNILVIEQVLKDKFPGARVVIPVTSGLGFHATIETPDYKIKVITWGPLTEGERGYRVKFQQSYLMKGKKRWSIVSDEKTMKDDMLLEFLDEIKVHLTTALFNLENILNRKKPTETTLGNLMGVK